MALDNSEMPQTRAPSPESIVSEYSESTDLDDISLPSPFPPGMALPRSAAVRRERDEDYSQQVLDAVDRAAITLVWKYTRQCSSCLYLSQSALEDLAQFQWFVVRDLVQKLISEHPDTEGIITIPVLPSASWMSLAISVMPRNRSLPIVRTGWYMDLKACLSSLGVVVLRLVFGFDLQILVWRLCVVSGGDCVFPRPRRRDSVDRLQRGQGIGFRVVDERCDGLDSGRKERRAGLRGGDVGETRSGSRNCHSCL